MEEQVYRDEQVAKVMLQVKKRKKKLSKLERMYDSKLASVSQSRFDDIFYKVLEKNYWVEMDLVDLGHNVMPMLSGERGGLSDKGQDHLDDLLHSFEQKKKDESKETRKEYKREIIIAIISALIGALLSNLKDIFEFFSKLF